MELKERIEMIEEAQEKMLDAIELVQKAVKNTENERNTEAYWISHAKILASDNHGFLSKDKNLDTIIEELREEQEIDD